MGPRLSVFFSACLLLFPFVGCANDAASPVAVAKAERDPGRCPKTIDAAFAAALVARHAKAYGSAEAAAGRLPISLVETATTGGKNGSRETNLTATSSRTQLVIGAVRTAQGASDDRPWTMQAGTGVVEHLAQNEAADAWFDGWLLRRRFTLPSELAAATFACRALPSGGARVDITYGREELGTPDYAFDLETAALLAVAYRRPDGRIAATTFEAWSEPDHGVRWPKKQTLHLAGGDVTSFELTAQKPGLACSRIEPLSGFATPEEGKDCAAPPSDRVTLRWPEPDAQGRVLARVPFTYLGGEILVRAKVDGREVNALLDSGAGVTAIDSTTPAGASFRAATELGGAASGQKVRLGFGELAKIELGGLVAEHVPAASVPIPALEGFGRHRPEVILGYGFFTEHVVRIDYANREVVLAKKKDGLFAKGKDTRELPFRVLNGKIVAMAIVEGVEAAFTIDTGNDGGLDLYKHWASAHGFPGTRPVVTMKSRFGAGAEATTSTFYRLAKASLGPIMFDDQLTSTSDPPESGLVAGLAGNTVLARCEAVVIDMTMRSITLEGSCDRPVPQRRVGWTFEKKSDPAHPDLPFVVNALFPNGGAEAAGVKSGDRLLEIGGKPATSDVSTWWPLEEQPAGTKLPVTLSRAGAPVKLVIELRDLAR